MDLKGMLQSGIGKEIKEKIEAAIEACKKDPSILSSLKDNPAEALKKLGINVDKEQVDQVAGMIKTGAAADKAEGVEDKIGDAAGMLKGLFGKK